MKNVEIKARTVNTPNIINFLLLNGGVFRGMDFQRDTYFNVPQGRLKLRDGNIEKALISYNRPNQSGPKVSDYVLHQCPENIDTLRKCLTHSLGVLVDVKKMRAIFYVKNVKIHLDQIDELGQFVEIEARDETDTVPEAVLLEQCQYFMQKFNVKEEDLIQVSYSDMLLNHKRLSAS